MRLSDFDYELPSELIAQYPLAERAASRLLVLGDGGAAEERPFSCLPGLLQPGDLMVFNDTQVVPARLRGRKSTGGRIEILVDRVMDTHRVLARTGSSKPLRVGGCIELAAGVSASCARRTGELAELVFSMPVASVLAELGEVPLPPYITRAPEPGDVERYQTIFARVAGAVAAPTAGLHFDHWLMEALRARGVELGFLTLHVGSGTFQPIRSPDPREHRMHAERYQISSDLCRQVAAAHDAGRRVVAVGTTTVRALETAARDGELRAGCGNTDLYILPGFRFRCVDWMLTNFHLPQSTLLMLVSAFAGREPVLAAYRQAVAARFRFFSYGDAMLVTRDESDLDAGSRGGDPA